MGLKIHVINASSIRDIDAAFDAWERSSPLSNAALT
jgi:hypothetical protein